MRFLWSIYLVFQGYLLVGQYAMNLGTSTSPTRSISHKVGYTEVEITYGSPSVKSRVIWGALEPYDEIWRAGANYATTISFSENVLIDSQPIDKGTYSLFIIPKENSPWEIILNSTAKQWGAFRYDASQDIIRISANPAVTEHQEQLLYDIASENSKGGNVIMMWEKVKVGFEFQTKLVDALEAQLERNIETATNATKWINYIQASEILLEEMESLDTAYEWINQAEMLSKLEMEWNPQFYPKPYVLGHLYWTKAKICSAMGNYKMGLTYAQKMKDMEDQVFVIKMNEHEPFDEIIKSWSDN